MGVSGHKNVSINKNAKKNGNSIKNASKSVKIIHQHHHHYIPKSKTLKNTRNYSTQTKKTGANTKNSSSQCEITSVQKSVQTDVSIKPNLTASDKDDDNLIYSHRMKQAKYEEREYIAMVSALASQIYVVYRFSDEQKVRTEIKEKFDICMRKDFVRELGEVGSIVNDVFNLFCSKYHLDSSSSHILQKFVSAIYP